MGRGVSRYGGASAVELAGEPSLTTLPSLPRNERSTEDTVSVSRSGRVSSGQVVIGHNRRDYPHETRCKMLIPRLSQRHRL